jgi:predicted DCC family thiol-disulfide oxidoreductase YuxK
MTTPKLTVWYNTKCPVCNRGIAWQNRRLVRAARSGAIEFRDINLEPDALARFGAGIEDVRRRLHGVGPDGRLYVGADCAIEIWRRTPGRFCVGSPVSHTTASPTSSMPGTAAMGAGESSSRDNLIDDLQKSCSMLILIYKNRFCQCKIAGQR